jgi:hypothetical protein
MNPEWWRSVVQHSQRTIARLRHDPRYESVCSDLMNRMKTALEQLSDSTGDDF